MKVRSQQTTTSDSDDTIDCNTKTLLMLAGESDPLVPVRWTKEAKVKAELIGLEASIKIMSAINMNLDNIFSDLAKEGFKLEKPPKGISFNLPLS